MSVCYTLNESAKANNAPECIFFLARFLLVELHSASVVHAKFHEQKLKEARRRRLRTLLEYLLNYVEGQYGESQHKS
jgi:hypothetical protein